MSSESALRSAIRELEEKLDRIEAEASETKKAINVLLRTLGEPPRFEDTEERSARQDDDPAKYFTKSITTAAREFLKSRGKATKLDEIVEALAKGSCKLGKHPVRNVKISLVKNSRTFAQPSTDIFGLWEFYGGPPRKRAVAAGEEEPEIEPEDATLEENKSEEAEEETEPAKDA